MAKTWNGIDIKNLPDGPGFEPFTAGRKDPFFWASIKHDFDYLQGGSLEDMIKADHTFYKNVTIVMQKSYNPLVWLRGLTYMGIVSLAGRWIWQRKNRLEAKGINYDEYVKTLR